MGKDARYYQKSTCLLDAWRVITSSPLVELTLATLSNLCNPQQPSAITVSKTGARDGLRQHTLKDFAIWTLVGILLLLNGPVLIFGGILLLPVLLLISFFVLPSICIAYAVKAFWGKQQNPAGYKKYQEVWQRTPYAVQNVTDLSFPFLPYHTGLQLQPLAAAVYQLASDIRSLIAHIHLPAGICNSLQTFFNRHEMHLKVSVEVAVRPDGNNEPRSTPTHEKTPVIPRVPELTCTSVSHDDGNCGVALRQAVCASGGHAWRLKTMLRSGIDPNCRSKAGMTPLHAAAWAGKGAESQYLLRYGANPNAQDEVGMTPLHVAVWRGHLSVLSVLLRAGADPSVDCHLEYKSTDEEFNLQIHLTSVHFALLQGNKLMVQMLLSSDTFHDAPPSPPTNTNSAMTRSPSDPTFALHGTNMEESYNFQLDLIEETMDRFGRNLRAEQEQAKPQTPRRKKGGSRYHQPEPYWSEVQPGYW